MCGNYSCISCERSVGVSEFFFSVRHREKKTKAEIRTFTIHADFHENITFYMHLEVPKLMPQKGVKVPKLMSQKVTKLMSQKVPW